VVDECSTAVETIYGDRRKPRRPNGTLAGKGRKGTGYSGTIPVPRVQQGDECSRSVGFEQVAPNRSAYTRDEPLPPLVRAPYTRAVERATVRAKVYTVRRVSNHRRGIIIQDNSITGTVWRVFFLVSVIRRAKLYNRPDCTDDGVTVGARDATFAGGTSFLYTRRHFVIGGVCFFSSFRAVSVCRELSTEKRIYTRTVRR